MSKETKPRKVAGAALIGNAVEWYDFYIYGTCTALIFPTVFFPNVDPAIAFVIAMASYGVGFITRPLGAILFGHFGDKLGRKNVLTASLLMMGISTFFIGLLPSYAEWGIASAVILCILRLFQGLAVGGEWGSAVVMAAEHAPPHRRGFFTSLVQIGAPLGMLLSTGAFSIIYLVFSEKEILDWAWRLPFLASLIMIGIGLYIRLNVEESPEFEKLKENKQLAKLPIKEVLKEDWRMVLRVGGSRIFQNTLFGTFTLFYLSYATTKMGVDKSILLAAIMITTVISLFNMPMWAHLSDIYGRRPIARVGVITSIMFIFPAAWLISTGVPIYSAIAIGLGYFIADTMYSVQSIHIPEQFGVKTRLTGTNLGYNLGGMVSGISLPIMGIILAWRDSLYDVGVFLLFLGIIAWLCLLPETLKKAKRN